MLGNYLIGLREGLEAALVVSILVAYLVKSDRRSQLPFIWLGVGVAVALSVGATLALGFQSRQLTFRTQELLGGVLSIVAAAFVTWMIFWMATAARSIAGDLRGRIDAAAGRWWSLTLVAFLAVGREGMETALILWSNTRTATGRDLPVGAPTSTTPLVGAVLGIATAVVLGYLVYRGAIKLNLTVFFTWTGVFLVLVAAGVLSYGVHDLQEAGVLPGLNAHLFDVSHLVPPGSWYGTVLKGIFNFSPQTTYLEAAAWLAYVGTVLPAFVVVLRRRRATSTTAPKPPVEAGA
ncbi:iron uptake transporter permease EfeU [Nocardioides nanhaiensis]|uniref:FTR1 family protein n=1 Tax=Nocardioides nanhaiensis TaxID=1476871 RepID=A0ABP8W886_9ACTN